MFQSKKGQFAVMMGLLLFLLLYFIYSSETRNTYIYDFGEIHIVDNIKLEVCDVLYVSNGTQINSSIPLMESDVSTYCAGKGYSCTLQFINLTPVPPSGNWSLLNYTHYQMNVTIVSKLYTLQENFTC
jgi:hypothetical protein